MYQFFFQSTYTKCNSVINKEFSYPLTHSLFKPVIYVSDVLQSLDTLKLSFSPGPDRIPSCILRNCSSYIALPLTLKFNLTLSQRRFPFIWKESFIVPLFKKGTSPISQIIVVLLNSVLLHYYLSDAASLPSS